MDTAKLNRQLAQRYRNQRENNSTFEDYEERTIEGYFWHGYQTDATGVATIVPLNGPKKGQERKIVLNYCTLPENFYREDGAHYMRFDLFKNEPFGALLETQQCVLTCKTLAAAQAAAERWVSKHTSGTFQIWGKVWCQVWKQVYGAFEFKAKVDDKVLVLSFSSEYEVSKLLGGAQ